MESNNFNNSEFLSWNSRGIWNKKPFLEMYTQKHQPLGIAIQEIKLKKDHHFSISNYCFLSEPLEIDGIAQGGVGFLMHKDVVHRRIPLKTKFQAIAIQARLHKQVTLCNIYINPRQAFTQADLEELTQQLPKPYILTGDFNSHNTLWYDRNTDLLGRGQVLETFILENSLNILEM